MKIHLKPLLRPLLLTTAITAALSTSSCIQTSGGLNGLGGLGALGGVSSQNGYPSQRSSSSLGSRGGFGSNYGQHSSPSYRSGNHQGQSHHQTQQKASQQSFPPGFSNDVKGLDYATDEVLDATNDYLKETGRTPPTGGYKNLYEAAYALESCCDTLEKNVSRGTSPQKAHQLIDGALEASSYLKLRISRHSDITPRLKNAAKEVHQELESLDRKLGH